MEQETTNIFQNGATWLRADFHLHTDADSEFDYKGETDHINKFIDQAFYGIPNFDKPDYPNSKLDLEEMVEALDQIGLGYFIVDIMEGGDEAFSRRKNIYSIWNIEKHTKA